VAAGVAMRKAEMTDTTPGQVKVKLLITNNSFCLVQRATAQSKTFVIMV
jgi:hypothetical protein